MSQALRGLRGGRVGRYGGFWIRLCAQAVDYLIVYLFLAGIGLLLQPAMALYAAGESFSELSALGIWLSVWWLYAAGSESSVAQATVGKRLFGLVVTDRQGRRISFVQATIRHWSKFISVAVLFLGFLLIALNKQHRGLHDLLSGCLIVRV